MAHDPRDYPRLTNAAVLISAMSDPENGDNGWTEADRAAMWRHQLATPIAQDIKAADPLSGIVAHRLAGAANPAIITYADLLLHSDPPVDLLRLVKDFGKREAIMPDGCLPQSIARCLYHSSILLARVRCGISISELPDHTLIEAVQSIARSAWIDQMTSSLLLSLASALSVKPAVETSEPGEAL